jgi:hypothetical protein
MPPLSHRRERFCRRYLATGNAAEAARSAGYSRVSARYQGHRLLNNPAVAARVAELAAAQAERCHGSLQTILVRTESLYQRAAEGRHYSAALRCLAFEARLAAALGLFPDPAEASQRRAILARPRLNLGYTGELHPLDKVLWNQPLTEAEVGALENANT